MHLHPLTTLRKTQTNENWDNPSATSLWLDTNEKMTKLAREISLVVITEFGAREYLKKLANSNWFQAFGCVLGFDWHSSGLTTTTCGAFKEGLKPLQKDLGLFVCSGKERLVKPKLAIMKSFTPSAALALSQIRVKISLCLKQKTSILKKRGKSWVIEHQTDLKQKF